MNDKWMNNKWKLKMKMKMKRERKGGRLWVHPQESINQPINWWFKKSINKSVKKCKSNN